MQKKSIKNLIFGLINFAVTTILGLLIPRLFILSYGSEMNGLINSLKQIFGYMALLEAGVGTATQQALYGAFARNDTFGISAILSATNVFYKRTGTLYAVGVVLIAAIYPLTVSSNIPAWLVVCIVLLQGEAGVVKYFVSAKLQLLINADGKGYVTTNIGTAFSIVSNLARVVLLYSGFNVLWVQGVFCVIDICQVFLIVVFVRKNYAWLDLHTKPDYSALEQKNSVLAHQLSGLVFNNTDSIILTYFCGLAVVSVYAMYNMLYAMIANIVGYISNSVVFALGQLFNKDREQFCKIQETYETYYLAISFALFTTAYIFILPFIRLYTKGVQDINYVDQWIPLLFLTCQILDYGRKTSSNIINFGRHFKQTIWRSMLETSINLVVSLCCVAFLGIYGVLIGTAAALCYRTNDMILYANHKILKRSAWPTYRRWLRNIALSAGFVLLSRALPAEYSNYLQLILVAIPVAAGVMLIYLTVNTLFEREARETAVLYLQPMVRKLKGQR